MATIQKLQTLGKLTSLVKEAGMTAPAWYASNGAPTDIVSLVAMGNKKFGSVMEKLSSNIFNCTNAPDKEGETGWDMEKGDACHRIEHKASRLWGDKSKARSRLHHWTWQHILPDHEWAYLMCTGVDLQMIRYYIIAKPKFMELIKAGIVTQQGGATGQGFWFSSKDMADHFHEFRMPGPVEADIFKDYTTWAGYEVNNNIVKIPSFAAQLENFIRQNPASHEAVPETEIQEALRLGTLVRETQKAEKAAAVAAKKAEKEAAKLKRKLEREAKKKEKEAQKALNKAKRTYGKKARENFRTFWNISIHSLENGPKLDERITKSSAGWEGWAKPMETDDDATKKQKKAD